MHSNRVVIAGGCALAFGASFANTGFVLHTGTSVSHLTGDIAKLTIDIASWSPETLAEAYRVAAAAGFFFCGAVTAGFLIHHPTLDLSRPYGRTVTGIGALFLAAACLVTRSPLVSIGLAGFGCGLQNAMANHYRGIVLRTTHLTGMFTDFGVNLGMKARGHGIPTWKIAVPLLIILSFCLGGACAVVSQKSGWDTVAIAGAAYLIAGIGWSIWKHGVLLPRERGRSSQAMDAIEE
ncbi:YoaK family protein [Botrimarina mediterranea]|uniref:DUF1275 domain protein n=1 Tax=Botrimarina mediterranea TaxID=2528022 RepID=A0A518K500_9BACT|nr:YoaK family protein [Botrimarina mediterranea]QDV72855.1 hypothetical protein Spa11_10380 [Botrimarina mediterranea]QDV77427.1 hypothetical protein K2D_10190 [Planctomycetes bacterium K2D]